MGQALRRYYRGATLAGVEDVVAGTRRNYKFDHQGTVQCLTDMQGNVTDRFASDAWGVPVKRTGTSINRQWYVGNLGYYRQVDQALDYVRARWLSYRDASWKSFDPQCREMGPSSRHWHDSPYRYADSSPAAKYDASGRLAVDKNCPPSVSAALNCICEKVMNDTITLLPISERACCDTIGVPAATYLRFLNRCNPPRKNCAQERSRRRYLQDLTRCLKARCAGTGLIGNARSITCPRFDLWCHLYGPCARNMAGLFAGFGGIILCPKLFVPGECSGCLAGFIFHEMAHTCGISLIDDSDKQPPFRCFEMFPCYGDVEDGPDFGVGPCYGI